MTRRPVASMISVPDSEAVTLGATASIRPLRMRTSPCGRSPSSGISGGDVAAGDEQFSGHGEADLSIGAVLQGGGRGVPVSSAQ